MTALEGRPGRGADSPLQHSVVWRRRMTARDIDEPHRASTPLELFFDLSFVVAVSQAAARLSHALAEGQPVDGVRGYLPVFFAIWWAWMNFTWFASAYDTDDVPYRLATFVQITGVLILAAGVPRAFDEQDFAVITLGYAVMRVGLVAQWLRAASGHPEGRRTARRFAAGVSLCMVGWVSLLFLPEAWRAAGFLVMVLAELSVPVWAEKAGRSPWHPEHIAERYGLFTLIVLGESVLAATVAFQSAIDEHDTSFGLYAVAVGGVLTVFAMWWCYFAKPTHQFLVEDRVAFVWGYGHYAIWSAAAAVGAGLEVGVETVAHHTEISARAAGATVTVPVAIFLVTVWALIVRRYHLGPLRSSFYPVAAAVVLATTATSQAVLLTGVTMVVLVAVAVTVAARDQAAASG